MAEIFRLLPADPTTESRLFLVKDKTDQDIVNIMGWRRLLPNKVAVPLPNAAASNFYQCSALDNHCQI